MNTFHCILGFWSPSLPELIVLGIVAVLLFGNRLPDVGRQLGRGIVEFKKGLREAKEELSDTGKKDHKDTDKDPSTSTKPYDDANKS